MGQRNPFARQVVLVVEDDPLLRMMAVDMVEDAGFDAIEASGADEAVEILESRSDVEVLFTDVDMPGSMNGVALANWARATDIPLGIVLTSGHHRPEDEDLPVRSVFFSKPYDFQKVVDTLRRMTA
ncbi:response regulator [Agrobacterium sp. BA1120]|uniref:response regulator n=1 Tax=Agrobacterium sp. BA1120 TaxID=3228927 RepID=UPI003369F7E9